MCSRSVVINHGSKIYDGNTEQLFERYQKHKKISLTFDAPMELPEIGFGVSMISETPYKKVMKVSKEKASELLSVLMKFNPSDISVEEEDIGTIVERIYGEEGSSLDEIS